MQFFLIFPYFTHQPDNFCLFLLMPIAHIQYPHYTQHRYSGDISLPHNLIALSPHNIIASSPHHLITSLLFFSESVGSLKGFGDVRLLLIRARKISIRIRIRAFQLNVDFFIRILFYVV